MPKFMLLLHERAGEGSDLSPEEIQGIIQKYRDWSQQMGEAGRLVGGDKLTDDNGKVLRPGGGGVSVTDGPYAETKEVIGGYFQIEANDYAEAVEISKTCPHLAFGGNIEIRQVDEV